MAFIEGGTMKEKRPLWRVSTFVAYFWALVYVVRSFFSTMFYKEDPKSSGRPSGRGYGSGRGGGGGGGGGGSGYNPGGGGTGSNPRRISGMSSIRGVDHNATCGSCCG